MDFIHSLNLYVFDIVQVTVILKRESIRYIDIAALTGVEKQLSST